MVTKVQGRCPACGSESLFLGEKGYVTCGVIGCKNPGQATDVLVYNPKRPGDSEADEARCLVEGERQGDYGSPAKNYEGIAHMWTGMLIPKLKPGAVITAEEAALLMVTLKLQRQMMKPKRDNLVDAHGYLRVAAHCRAESER